MRRSAPSRLLPGRSPALVTALREWRRCRAPTDALQLGGRVVTQHPGEGAVRGQGSAIASEQTETYRRPIRQRSKQRFGVSEGVLHPAPRDHRFLQLNDLLAETGDLVNEVLFGTVVVSHRDIMTAGREPLALAKQNETLRHQRHYPEWSAAAAFDLHR